MKKKKQKLFEAQLYIKTQILQQPGVLEQPTNND